LQKQGINGIGRIPHLVLAGTTVVHVVFTVRLVVHGVEREVALDAIEHIVPASGVAADEARGMGKGNRKPRLDVALLALLMKTLRSSPMTSAMQVVETRSSPAYKVPWRSQTIEHVPLAAEDRLVFGHGIGNGG